MQQEIPVRRRPSVDPQTNIYTSLKNNTRLTKARQRLDLGHKHFSSFKKKRELYLLTKFK